MTRHVTALVLGKIEQWEGLRLTPYQDIAGVWTDGFGNTHGVKPGKPITITKARADLRKNLLEAEYTVDKLVKVELSDNQFGALVAFVFNVGVTAFASSTLLRLLNAGNVDAVPGQLARWNKITVKGKKVVAPGLTNRRAAEAGLWAMGAFVESSGPIAPMQGSARSLTQTKTMQGAAATSVGVVGSTLVDSANQVQMVADYSDTLRMLFVALMVGGVALTIYGRVRLRNTEDV